MPHSQGLSNNSYPEPNQPNYHFSDMDIYFLFFHVIPLPHSQHSKSILPPFKTVSFYIYDPKNPGFNISLSHIIFIPMPIRVQLGPGIRNINIHISDIEDNGFSINFDHFQLFLHITPTSSCFLNSIQSIALNPRNYENYGFDINIFYY